MKLDRQDDFTKLPKASSVIRAAEASGEATGSAALPHDERHLRRRVVFLDDGGRVLVDLPEAVHLDDGDRLLLEDGRQIAIAAEPEPLMMVMPSDPLHLAELCWHIGNRHLAAQIETDRILLLRDHVIADMLRGLGATVSEIEEPFHPVHGAYAGHGGHHHDAHGQRDAYGRSPGDPHYGHNHGPDHDQHGHDHHGHDDGHGHHEHDHDHGKRDAHGRLPGDPHYGHNHG